MQLANHITLNLVKHIAIAVKISFSD